MGNFNRGKRSGDRGGGGKDFKKQGGGSRDFGSGRGFGGRDGGRPQMHDVVCAECGNDCQVPFRPTGDKPVYCSQCFDNQGGRNSGSGRDRSRGSNFTDKKMHDAVCAECGNDCQVPFRPSGDKPVYCSQCFKKNDRSKGDNSRGQSPEQFKDQFAVLNSKLDKILAALSSTAKTKTTAVKKAPKKTTTTKTPVKKAVQKKAATKKTVKKKKK